MTPRELRLKKNGIQILLQLLDRLADSRLADIKVPGTVGDTAGTCYRIKKYDKETDYPACKTFLSKNSKVIKVIKNPKSSDSETLAVIIFMMFNRGNRI